jgi:hypothetical protein
MKTLLERSDANLPISYILSFWKFLTFHLVLHLCKVFPTPLLLDSNKHCCHSYYSYQAYWDFGFPDIFISREVFKLKLLLPLLQVLLHVHGWGVPSCLHVIFFDFFDKM